MEWYDLLIAFLISYLCRLISHSYRCFLEYCFAKLERVWMIDRISGLPDSLIQHILSFLPTKDAARTCILSTRWKDTWIGTPTIDVELHRLFKTNSTETYKENFINFMDRLILLHEGYNIDKINFAYSTSFDSARVTSWVSTLLMQHKVKDLHIHESLSEIPFLMGISLPLPISIFTNESLTRLRIRIDSIVQIPISLCMSNLRDLDLNRIVFSCEHLTQQVLFSFPNLESFIIISCHWKNTQAVRICAPRLKVLFILDRTWDECCEINIDAPSLMSFRFGSLEYNLPNLSSLVPKYSLSNLSSLDNATIDVLFQPSASDYAIKFFRDISSIKNLSVSGGTITTLCDAINSFHQLTLSNVTILNVAYITTRNMSSQDFGRNRLSSQDFIKFVHMLPNLESLGFPRGVGEFCKEEDYGVLEVTVPSSLSKLKAIGVLFFEGNDLEVFLIELFLKNAMVLERMTILPSRKLLENGWNHMKSRLLQVPRAHGSCRIYTS